MRALRAPVVLAVVLLASCAPKGQTQLSSISGPPPKIHDVHPSPDGRWALTVVERHPTDPDLIGTTWQVWIGPADQPVDSTHCIFDAQELQPAASWRTADSISIVVSGDAGHLADIPPEYHTSETVLGRDLRRHTFAVHVTQAPPL